MNHKYNKQCQYLLFESADAGRVSAAIVGMHPVFITYDDQQGGGGKNKRFIYPVAYGISTAGNPVVRAFQPQGSTKRGTPKWKLFRLDRIKFWRTITSKTFDPDALIGLNKGGDEQMETLYAILPIGKAKNIKIDKEPIALKTTPITKSDIENQANSVAQKDVQNKEIKKEKMSANDIVNNIVGRITTRAKGLLDKIKGSKQKNPQKINIDNKDEKSYNNDEWQKYKMTAQDDNPIYKSEIPNGNSNVNTANTETTQTKDGSSVSNNDISDEPITKDDINNTTNDSENDNDYSEDDADELAKTQLEEIKNLMYRMDILYDNNKKYLNLL